MRPPSRSVVSENQPFAEPGQEQVVEAGGECRWFKVAEISSNKAQRSHQPSPLTSPRVTPDSFSRMRLLVVAVSLTDWVMANPVVSGWGHRVHPAPFPVGIDVLFIDAVPRNLQFRRTGWDQPVVSEGWESAVRAAATTRFAGMESMHRKSTGH